MLTTLASGPTAPGRITVLGAVASGRFSERLEGVTVADGMDTQPVWVPGDTTVLEAQDEFFLRYRWSWFPVADAHSGRFLGLLHQARVASAVEAGQPDLTAELAEGREAQAVAVLLVFPAG